MRFLKRDLHVFRKGQTKKVVTSESIASASSRAIIKEVKGHEAARKASDENKVLVQQAYTLLLLLPLLPSGRVVTVPLFTCLFFLSLTPDSKLV